MSHILWDPDEWETVWHYRECSCGGLFSGNCRGHCNASSWSETLRRSPEAIAAIKEEKRKKHEEKVIQEYNEIIARRALEIFQASQNAPD